ncbi:hypothetical protein Q1695_011888 [Nippostrongylus brasiliensis]|nr:hypothetical protein Q1695_011888 [Nippostrongylus brasiliensis]
MTAMVNDGNVERMFKMRMIVMMGALLPGIGCYFCIAYTYIFQFDVIKNFTQSDQCPEVNSILPPVSYAIGIWEPQRYFWLFIMFLHCPPRIFFLILYRRAFRNAAPKSACYRRVIYFYTKTMWSELVGLVAVSVLDIKCNFVIHAIARILVQKLYQLSVDHILQLQHALQHHPSSLRRYSGDISKGSVEGDIAET